MKEAGRSKPSKFYTLENTHPYMFLIYLAIGGISLVFIFLLGGFISSTPDLELGVAPRYFPKAFVVSTLVLLASGYFLNKLNFYFAHDQLDLLKRNLQYIFGMGLVFCGLQVYGWQELSENGVYLNGKASDGYLFLLSGLHLAHLLGGLVFLLVVYRKIQKLGNDPVHALLYFSSAYEKMRIKMLYIYWHFMDLLWIAIFASFLLSR